MNRCLLYFKHIYHLCAVSLKFSYFRTVDIQVSLKFQDFARYNFSLNRVRQRTSTTCSEFDRMSSLQQHAKLHIELFDAYHTLLFPLSLNK